MYEFIGRTSVNYGVQGKVDRLEYDPNPANTFSLAQVGETVALFRKNEWYGSQNMFVLVPLENKIIENHLFFEAVFYRILRKYSDAYIYPLLDEIKNLSFSLPIKENKIDYDLMKQITNKIETLRIEELEAYLSVSGLNNCDLTIDEENAIKNYSKLNWKEFNLEKLFGKSNRGKRLKSEDRIEGDLPFVTAGEADEGVSDFIGNTVDVYSANTTTIDMFGSAKYRNYKYGADDHIAVVHTEFLEKYAAIFVTTAIHKSSHNGQFSYDKNFYAKDADALNIQLPSIGNEPDYKTMSLIISAIHKMVLKDVISYLNNK